MAPLRRELPQDVYNAPNTPVVPTVNMVQVAGNAWPFLQPIAKGQACVLQPGMQISFLQHGPHYVVTELNANTVKLVSALPPHSVMQLKAGERCSIGRANDSVIPISDVNASRRHGTIEFQRELQNWCYRHEGGNVGMVGAYAMPRMDSMENLLLVQRLTKPVTQPLLRDRNTHLDDGDWIRFAPGAPLYRVLVPAEMSAPAFMLQEAVPPGSPFPPYIVMDETHIDYVIGNHPQRYADERYIEIANEGIAPRHGSVQWMPFFRQLLYTPLDGATIIYNGQGQIKNAGQGPQR